MGKIYQVTVQEIMEDGDGVSVIELTAPVEMLRQFAPSAVAAALGTSVQVTDQQLDDARERLQGIGVISSEGNFGAGQPKRRRRTKAEMEAARNGEIAVQATDPGGGPITLAEVMPIPAATVPDTQVEKAGTYNPFG